MTTFLVVDDLTPFAEIDAAKAQTMIDDASALAVLAAPCLGAEPSETQPPLTVVQLAAVKAILRGAIVRWNDSGSGALSGQTAGPFGQTLDTRTPRRSMFYPSEIAQLRDICGGTSPSGAFSIDTASGVYGLHADACSINFGALYCSCGVDIAGYPLFGA